MATHLLKAIEISASRENPDLTALLEASLEIGLVKPKAITEVRILLEVGTVRDLPIDLWTLATLDRQLAMMEQATRLGVYPFLMRQTAHRVRRHQPIEIVQQELESRSQRIFLSTVPLTMLLT